MMNEIQSNIATIRTRMNAAAEKAGRRGEDILLVGASKMNNSAACRAAIAAGIDALGENRVQEMTQKLSENAYEGVPLHFIGHLQRNKVKQVVGRVALIQSVGSIALLDAIDGEAQKQGITQDILLEVNIGAEESKSGFLKEELPEAAAYALTRSHLQVKGLMTIPPVEAVPHGNLPYFEEMQRLYVDISAKLYHNRFEYLSMGMSDDYEEAIAAGATMIRVGSAIFGKRSYQ